MKKNIGATIHQNSVSLIRTEEVHNLQSPDEEMILVLLYTSVKRFSLSRMRDFFYIHIALHIPLSPKELKWHPILDTRISVRILTAPPPEF